MSVIRLIVIGIYTVFWGALGCVLSVFDRSGEAGVWVAHSWIAWILKVCRIEIRAEGLENLDPDQPYVFMSNHQSHFDVAAIVSSIPVSWRFVAKRELVFVPFFGWALALGGHIIVDRSNRSRAISSMREGARRIRNGTNVIIFPEGTRSESGELGEFKSGGFHIALQAGVPILPVSVIGSRDITPKHSLRILGGVIRVVYGKPIPTGSMGPGDRGVLKEQVRGAIREGLSSKETESPAEP